MSLDELERRMIREAQRELGPAPALRQRHELALLERLARGAPAAGEASRVGALAHGRPSAEAAPWLVFSGLPGRMLGVGLAVGVLVGSWIGYSLGQRGSAQASAHGATVASAPVDTGEVAEVAEPAPIAAGSELGPQPAAARSLESEPATSAAAIGASVGTELRGAAPRPPRRAVPARRHAGESSLADELAMLQRARRALGAGNGQLALGIVRELDERFPKGVLMEERDATRVLSLCALARVAEAREVARGFFAQHPGSVYAERVRKSCIETPE